MNIQAVIFDMDGVISDTQKLHAKIESDILSRFEINFSPEEITEKYARVKTIQFFGKLLKDRLNPYDLEKIIEEKWSRATQLADESVDEIDGSIKLIQNLYSAGLKIAVASASNQAYVQNIIRHLNLDAYFKCLISGDMVSNEKPDPEIFLLTASKIGVTPANCIVIEDGISGM
jgi:HAD superfamily hydrolase (TIGR01509 family)